MATVNVSVEFLKDINKNLKELMQKINEITIAVQKASEQLSSVTLKASDKTVSITEDLYDLFKVHEVVYPGSAENALKLFNGKIDNYEAFVSAVNFDAEQMSYDGMIHVMLLADVYFERNFPTTHNLIGSGKCIYDPKELEKLKDGLITFDPQISELVDKIIRVQKNNTRNAKSFLRELVIDGMSAKLRTIIGVGELKN